jgi:outer membrane protein OmpA-like peptidoglycan-associated protein
MRKLLTSLIGIFLVGMVWGQQSEESYIKRPSLGISVGAYDFLTAQRIRSSSLSSVVGDKQWAGLKEMSIALGINFIKGISNNVDYSINFYTGNTDYPPRTGTGDGKTGFLHELDASLHLKLLTDKSFFTPYLKAGIGGSLWKDRFESFMPLGGGFQFKLAPDFFLLSELQYRVPVTQGANYHFLYTLGFAGSLGDKPKPVVKQAPPAPVVVPPAPVDTDKDGIFDPEDKCPTVPGVAKYQGCPIPDTDGDGINDELDKCPTVAGVAKYEGCPVPDTDNDGFKDDVDNCITVPGIAKYNGCPIPDTDGDGINDEEDKCPTVAGIRELFGCPRPDFKAENVLFSSGKSVLVASGKKELDIIVKYLADYTGFNVTATGFTDNSGDEKFNQALSEKRAAAAKTYLVSKGVDASRITTNGKGESDPVADNKTAEGRKKNRRVEFSIDQ